MVEHILANKSVKKYILRPLVKVVAQEGIEQRVAIAVSRNPK